MDIGKSCLSDNAARADFSAFAVITSLLSSAVGTRGGINKQAFVANAGNDPPRTPVVGGINRRIELDAAVDDGMLYADRPADSRLSTAGRRVFDLIVSSVLLLLALPLMVITAVLVRLTSRGPVIYRQLRAGLLGKPFTVLKFRSMSVDAEADGRPTWAQQRDPRVTRVGSFIRSMRIDELPQLVNVLRGEMSMIGPRPERPHFVEQLARVIPLYQLRVNVKPGLTGWAQVNSPYGASVEDAREKLSYDLYYVKNRNFVMDLQILVATVRVILFRKGAR
jgi:exopolysaccharide biosynthesis polyprenyl glycosylphosphotransferase